MSDNILQNKNVLVAEDNAINQLVVKHTLLKLGANADIAGDGAEAIEKLKKNKYDLILMDIQMPLMDGYEATAYIRKQLGSDIPIIAMTAFALNGEDEKCIDCGMNDYVSKPFTAENLSSVIQKVLSAPLSTAPNPSVIADKDFTVDLSLLYDIAGNDESFAALMIQTFLENMPLTLKRIEQGSVEQDWDALYSAAHYAKSSLSVIKVNEMYEAVTTIEMNAKKRINLDEIPALVKKASDSFLLAQEVLSEKFGAVCA